MKTQKLGEYLKNARLKNSLTQSDLKNFLKIKSPQYISNIERGLCAPSVEAIKAYNVLCGIDTKKVVKWLVDDYVKSYQDKLKGFGL